MQPDFLRIRLPVCLKGGGIMRTALLLCTIALVCLLSGCGPSKQQVTEGPVLTGKLEGGSFWQKPLISPSNEGGEYEKGSKVEVFDQFVVVTSQDGISRVHPHGYYSGLRIKRD